jgi:RimJ/RimL family protein N-acetyltransferase
MILSSEEMPFAETKSLRMRAVREGDIKKLAVLIDDPRTQRTGPDYIVPRESALIKALPHQVEDGSLLFAILEAKSPADDGDTWAGFIGLAKPRPVKNRDTEMSICIAAKFWGKGLGEHSAKQYAQACMHQPVNRY